MSEPVKLKFAIIKSASLRATSGKFEKYDHEIINETVNLIINETINLNFFGAPKFNHLISHSA
jgi:hypothetical protein